MKTLRSLPAGLIGCSLLLTACGGAAAPSVAPAAPSSPSSPAAAVAPSQAAAPSAKPAASASAKPAAEAPGGSAASNAPIKVGILLPLTGPLAQVGQDSEDGFQLYLDSINSTVLGRKIEPLYTDTKGAADQALTKAKQLVENDKVTLLMGLNGTPECYAVAPYVREAQVPLIVSTNCGAQTLTTDPKYASPYLARITQTSFGQQDPVGDWAYKKGYRKIALVVDDFGGALEAVDSFADTFIRRGGQIVQEQYPALGTTDFGPFVAQLKRDGVDAIADVLFGGDPLRWYEAYLNYGGGQSKIPIIDISAGISAGPNRAQLKDKVLGITSTYLYTTAYDSPENAAFIKAYKAKFPGRYVAKDSASSYAGAMVLEAAIKKVNGNVEDKQKFLQAIDDTNLPTNKGPVKLDSHHDIIQNIYIFDFVKNGDSIDERMVDTYKDVPPTGLDRTEQEIAKFPIGQMKGKWVGMTADQLKQIGG
ncbi:MAG TPA: ABC transporter substrate-binding protein [Chloroflexota bacterium]|nr:ABC transporter substrate-binding protein [Chloroflexota bacterium]